MVFSLFDAFIIYSSVICLQNICNFVLNANNLRVIECALFKQVTSGAERVKMRYAQIVMGPAGSGKVVVR